jgi:hypothetical protein
MQVSSAGSEVWRGSLQYIKANTELLINDVEADEKNKNSDASSKLSDKPAKPTLT